MIVTRRNTRRLPRIDHFGRSNLRPTDPGVCTRIRGLNHDSTKEASDPRSSIKRAPKGGRESRFEELDAELISPEVLRVLKGFGAWPRERSRLEEIVGLGRKLARATQELEGALELCKTRRMTNYKPFAEAECTGLQQLIEKLLLDLREVLIPKDPLSDRAAVVEIRAGTGGDEAGLFAADLKRMYRRLAERKGWSIELMSHSEGIPGSIKAVIFTVRGKGVRPLALRVGVHRVPAFSGDRESRTNSHFCRDCCSPS
ncbi:MAG: hypothetical protein Ct9H300mP15_28750 [Gemmatimonadota bacterium]|nr:MAG: hypothetical protein Ct9H300mP15_28750 [Gemmatimonadota bacterium]